MWLLLLHCAAPQWGLNPAACDPRTLAPGELRGRQIPCSDELSPGGEGRKLDWLLENAVVRYTFRDRPSSLTQIGVAGGTLIDAGPPGYADTLSELVPLVAGARFTEVELALEEGQDRVSLRVEGLLEDGTSAALRYSLRPDSAALEIEGADQLWMVPPVGAVPIGQLVESAPTGGLVFGAGAPLEQPEEGRFQWTGAQTFTAGLREQVFLDRGPTRTISGSTEADWVELWQEGELHSRFFAGGAPFEAVIPAEIDALVGRREGYAPGEAVAATGQLVVPLGEQAELLVRVADEQGRDIWASAVGFGQRWPLRPGGARLPTGPSTSALRLEAGPAFERLDLPEVVAAPTEDGQPTRISAQLRRAIDGPQLARFDLPAWPDAREGRHPDRLAEELLAEGVVYAVVHALDEVALPGMPDLQAAGRLSLWAGSRPASPVGSPLAWPWGRNSRSPAHGAAWWPGEEAQDLLALMSYGGSRLLAVDRNWVESAGPAPLWNPRPDLLLVDGINDLPLVTALMDEGWPLWPISTHTWLEAPEADPSTLDLEAALLAGRVVAGNGPFLRLRTLGKGPGELLPRPLGALLVELEVMAPRWMPLQSAWLVGPGGQELGRWPIAEEGVPRLRLRTSLPPWIGYLMAACEGPPDADGTERWAMSAPLRLGPPEAPPPDTGDTGH